MNINYEENKQRDWLFYSVCKHFIIQNVSNAMSIRTQFSIGLISLTFECAHTDK